MIDRRSCTRNSNTADINCIVLDDSTGQIEPTTEPAPPRRKAEVRPPIPAPSVELPTDVSHEERIISAFFLIRCRMTSKAETALGPTLSPSNKIDDWRAFLMSK